jgi:TonB family protein
MSDVLAASPAARAIGFALLDFVWQGAAIGVVTAFLLILLRRTSAQARYIVACLGLATMLAAPTATAVGYLREAPTPAQRAYSGASPLLTTPAWTTQTAAISISASEQRPGIFTREWLEPRLPFVVLIWSAGVLLLALHLVRGWIRIRRIQQRAMPLSPNRWPEKVRLAADRLGVTRRLRLLVSSLVDVPAVVGWLRPAILVPASALAGLPASHLEAILVHELAHVRRADYFVNAIQCVIEVLLFYHPAVWWVSRQIRREREHCCDDIAAFLCADRVAYARALTSLEELRIQTPALAVGARGGELLNRIRRLVEPESASGPKLSGGFAMGVVFTILLLALNQHVKGMPGADVPPTVPAIERAIELVPAVPTPAEPAQKPPATTPSTSRPQTVAVPVPRDAGVRQIANSASISGTVQDQHGGVIPGATVTVSSQSTTVVRTAVTDARGQFAISDLGDGAHELTVTLPGFRASRSAVQVAPGEKVTANVQLLIGSLSELITVRAEASSPRAAAPVSQVPVDLRTAADYFEAASVYYQQGQLAEAQRLTARAVELLRSATPETAVAAPPISETGVVRVGGDIRPPRKIRDVKPIYPADAIAAGAEGMIVMDAIIAKDGTVLDATVLRSVPMLDEAALGAVRLWRFTPTLLNGAPVEVSMTVTVNFSLR